MRHPFAAILCLACVAACGRGALTEDGGPPREVETVPLRPPGVDPDASFLPPTLKAIRLMTESFYFAGVGRAVPVTVDLEFEGGGLVASVTRGFVNPVTGRLGEFRWGSTNVGVVYITPDGVLKPVSSGKANVWGRYEGLTVKIPVHVATSSAITSLPVPDLSPTNQTSDAGGEGSNPPGSSGSDVGSSGDGENKPAGGEETVADTGDGVVGNGGDGGSAGAEEGTLPGAAPTPFADRVVFFARGQGGGWGLTAVDGLLGIDGLSGRVFPDIVLGPPVGTGDSGAGSLDVLSLGRSGIVEVEMTDLVIVDGPGPDFIVFENPLPDLPEPGRVSVSQDGLTYTPFPCDPENPPFSGCAGVRPVYANPYSPDAAEAAIDPLDPNRAGGDAFDLANLGIAWVRYVRIEDTDMCGRATALRHLYCAPETTGFDLDAIAVIHGRSP